MKLSRSHPPEGTVRDWLDHRARENAGEICHLFPENQCSLTWDTLRDQARSAAHGLTARGVQKGESVALMLPNGPDAVLALFAALYGGFRATMINLVAGADAVGFALEHSGARFVILGQDQRDLFDTASSLCGSEPEALAFPELLTSSIDALDLHDVSSEDIALLMYTSGTTGRPKGVLHSHASLLAGGWTPFLAHDLSGKDRALCVLPIFHINGLCVTLIAPLISGGTAIVCNRFSATRFWATCAEYQATWFSVVPTIISHLLHGDRDPDPATRSRIRFGRSASSALAPEVQSAFETRFAIPIVETMGLTETAAQILSNPLPPGVRKIGSPGLAFGNEVAVIGSDQTPLGRGNEGEIAVRGPNVMVGYLNNPEATAEALTEDRWLRTGDLGRIDQDGYVFVTGRLKELIIKGGENIAPREVDEALYAHADVIEAAAFARPCQSYGERVEAAVRLRAGSLTTEAHLLALCRDRLGAFKTPDAIHFLDELPKGPSGKIQRLKLAEITRADAAV